jgi:hypothetical protein
LVQTGDRGNVHGRRFVVVASSRRFMTARLVEHHVEQLDAELFPSAYSPVVEIIASQLRIRPNSAEIRFSFMVVVLSMMIFFL